MITSTSVVDDPVRTNSAANVGFSDAGIEDADLASAPMRWRARRARAFGRCQLMRDIAPTPADAPAMTEQLFQTWLTDQNINGFVVAARPAIQQVLFRHLAIANEHRPARSRSSASDSTGHREPNGRAHAQLGFGRRRTIRLCRKRCDRRLCRVYGHRRIQFGVPNVARRLRLGEPQATASRHTLSRRRSTTRPSKRLRAGSVGEARGPDFKTAAPSYNCGRTKTCSRRSFNGSW